MTLPSEKLQKRITPVRAVAIGAASLVVIAGAAFGVPAAVHAMTPAPKPAPVVAVAGPMECDGTVQGQGLCVTAAEQTQAEQQVAQVEADNAAKAKAAADALAAQQAADQAAAEQAARDAAAKKTVQRSTAPVESGNGGGLPSGATVPQPNGYPDTTQCASGSASTINGVPTCD